MLGQQLVNGLALGLTYSLTAIGFTLIFGVLGLINFAHGEVYMVGAFIAFTLVAFLHVNYFVAFLLAIAFSGLMGYFLELIAFRPLRNAIPEATLIATLGVSTFLKEFANIIWGPEVHTINTPFLSSSFAIGGIQISVIQIVILVVSVLLMWGLQIILYKTKTGYAIRAISQDMGASYLMGVNVDNTIAMTFVIGSALGGAAGVLMGTYYGAFYPTMGYMPGLKAFVAMVLGGLTSIPGAVLGGVILGISETLAGAYISAGVQDAISFLILIAILLFFPQGLSGKKRGV